MEGQDGRKLAAEGWEAKRVKIVLCKQHFLLYRVNCSTINVSLRDIFWMLSGSCSYVVWMQLLVTFIWSLDSPDTHLESSWPSWSCEPAPCQPGWWATSWRLLQSAASSCPSWGRFLAAPPPLFARSAALGSVQEGARWTDPPLVQLKCWVCQSCPVRTDGSLASSGGSCSFHAPFAFLRQRERDIKYSPLQVSWAYCTMHISETWILFCWISWFKFYLNRQSFIFLATW